MSVGYASTVKVTRISGTSWPMSDSATLVCTSIARRSSAIVNSVGADSEAATVWPSDTSREITTPSIGDTIVV